MLLSNRTGFACRLAVLLVTGLITLSFLSGCGFRLQGSNDFPKEMQTTFIDTKDRYTPFYRDLKITLEQSGITVTESPIDAGAVIRLEKDDTGQNVLTVSKRNVPTEYNVYYRIRYSVIIDGEKRIPSRSLGRQEDYTFDPEELLGKNRESAELRDAISRDLARQVSYEISRLKN